MYHETHRQKMQVIANMRPDMRQDMRQDMRPDMRPGMAALLLRLLHLPRFPKRPYSCEHQDQ